MSKNYWSRITLLSLITFSSAFCVNAYSNNANIGEEVYLQRCSSCHGQQAQGNKELQAPALAAQISTYTVRQFEGYQQGRRGPQDEYATSMAVIAKTLENKSIYQMIALYLQSLPLTEQSSKTIADKAKANESADSDLTENATNSENHRLGHKLYQSSCGGCHGSVAQGNAALESPRLSGLDVDYLERQYGYFLTGKRGMNTNNKYGRQMAMIASTQRDKQKLKSLFAYISAL